LLVYCSHTIAGTSVLQFFIIKLPANETILITCLELTTFGRLLTLFRNLRHKNSAIHLYLALIVRYTAFESTGVMQFFYHQYLPVNEATLITVNKNRYALTLPHEQKHRNGGREKAIIF
jgi:hypothetical protein